LAKLLLDSDVIIEWLRGRESVVQQIERLFSEHSQLFWTPVSIAEIYAGVRKGEEEIVAKLFLLLEVVPLTAEIGEKAGGYLKSFAKSHGLELGDALIAASATCESLLLWTQNKKHYRMKDLVFYT
jgi:predicted nucleic acid-binding protein